MQGKESLDFARDKWLCYPHARIRSMGVQGAVIAENLAQVRERILRAAQRAGRKPEEITLVAVSKTFPAEAIRAAYQAGLRHFGENRVQEWELKQPLLTDLDATWHLVGHLQSNKAVRAARLFHTFDSLDSITLAQRLDRVAGELRASASAGSGASPYGDGGYVEAPVAPASSRRFFAGQPNAEMRRQDAGATTGALKRAGADAGTRITRLPVLIEVRLAPEETKTGVTEGDLPACVGCVLALPHLDLRGLMCIPPFFEDPEQSRPYFRKLRELRDSLRRQLAPAFAATFPSSTSHAASETPRPSERSEECLLPELSMGMSHDFEVAIEEGATQVRLGTAIFGERRTAEPA